MKELEVQAQNDTLLSIVKEKVSLLDLQSRMRFRELAHSYSSTSTSAFYGFCRDPLQWAGFDADAAALSCQAGNLHVSRLPLSSL